MKIPAIKSRSELHTNIPVHNSNALILCPNQESNPPIPYRNTLRIHAATACSDLRFEIYLRTI